MNLGRPDPRFSTRGKILDDVCRSLELAGWIVYPESWLSRQKARRENSSQEGDDYMRVGTRLGAHLRTQSEKRASEHWKYQSGWRRWPAGKTRRGK
jgi:hypothetical protein